MRRLDPLKENQDLLLRILRQEGASKIAEKLVDYIDLFTAHVVFAPSDTALEWIERDKLNLPDDVSVLDYPELNEILDSCIGNNRTTALSGLKFNYNPKEFTVDGIPIKQTSTTTRVLNTWVYVINGLLLTDEQREDVEEWADSL